MTSAKPTQLKSLSGKAQNPAAAACCLGKKFLSGLLRLRTLPMGVDQRSACRHPDWTGPDDLEIKIEELREITDWEKTYLRQSWCDTALL